MGAVAYFLVTGKLVFEADTVVGMCEHHLSTPPPAPTKRTTNAIPAELEATILACLAKEPSKRPASARALASMLAKIPLEGWTHDDASMFWNRFEEGPPAAKAAPRDLGIADTLAIMPRVPIASGVDDLAEGHTLPAERHVG